MIHTHCLLDGSLQGISYAYFRKDSSEAETAILVPNSGNGTCDIPK